MKSSGIPAAEELYTVRRGGRLLVVELLKPHRVLCTSAHGGDLPRARIFVTTTCLIFAGATALAIWRLCT